MQADGKVTINIISGGGRHRPSFDFAVKGRGIPVQLALCSVSLKSRYHGIAVCTKHIYIIFRTYYLCPAIFV